MHECVAGTKNTALFDIVNEDTANGSVASRGFACLNRLNAACRDRGQLTANHAAVPAPWRSSVAHSISHFPGLSATKAIRSI
jgi:hypothetical protein